MNAKIIGVVAALFIVTSCSSSDEMDMSSADTVVVDDSVEDVMDEATDDEVAEFAITVGKDSGRESTLTVPVGTEVRLVLVNPNEDDEFHLHGYDLGGAMTPAGEEAIIQFTASEVGEFEVESHVTGDVLMVLIVE
jgi:hypothetical protein